MTWADGQDEISNSEDIIDSREIVERIEFLTKERKDLTEAWKDAKRGAAKAEAKEALETWDTDYKEELDSLVAFAEELGGYCSDWRHGTTLVRDSHWEEYTRETAEELYGKELRDSHWPFNCIDWERAARELQMDYTSGEFDGVTYWAR